MVGRDTYIFIPFMATLMVIQALCIFARNHDTVKWTAVYLAEQLTERRDILRGIVSFLLEPMLGRLGR